MLERFIEIFKKAVLVEMDAMRDRLGPFEVALSRGRLLEAASSGEASPGEDSFLFGFHIAQANDKLALGIDCSLVAGSGDHLVTVIRVDKEEIVLRCAQAIDLEADPMNLVIYPWFLYERLLIALQSLLESESFHVDTAVALFGKGPAQALPPAAGLLFHEELNDSQCQAVQLCCDVTPAFVWGPPGTGKTTTLGHILTTLLAQDKRILVTSTTNAAVDQALAKLAQLEAAQEALEGGRIVRLGQTHEATFGAGLREVAERLDVRRRDRMARLRQRQESSAVELEACTRLLSKLPEDGDASQMELFSAAEAAALSSRDLEQLFSQRRARLLAGKKAVQQRQSLTSRRRRLEACRDLCGREVQRLFREQRRQEAGVVDNAQLILSTMTNVYISSLYGRATVRRGSRRGGRYGDPADVVLLRRVGEKSGDHGGRPPATAAHRSVQRAIRPAGDGPQYLRGHGAGTPHERVGRDAGHPVPHAS